MDRYNDSSREHRDLDEDKPETPQNPKRLPPRSPDLYRPFGQQTLRGRALELEAEQQLADWEQSGAADSKRLDSKDYYSADDDSSSSVQPYYVKHTERNRSSKHRTSSVDPKTPEEDFYLDFEAMHRRQEAQGPSRDPDRLKRSRELYRKRKRKQRILAGLALFFTILLLGGFMLLRYLTGGAQLGITGATVREDFTLPPLGEEVPEGWGIGDEPPADNPGVIVVPEETTPEAGSPTQGSGDLIPIPHPEETDQTGTDGTRGEMPIESEETAAPTPAPTTTTQTLTLPAELNESTRTWNKDIMNILLLGVDTRDMSNLNTRSDTMMVLTIDRIRNELKLTSFQRDMLIFIPGYESQGERKLNEGMYFGPQTTIAAINYYFNMDIDDFVVINISGAEKIIDAVGGIRVDIPTDPDVLEYYNAVIREQNWMMDVDNPENYVSYFDEGGEDILVNGRQAIAYARMRETDDYRRMGRQQEVIMKLYDKLMDSDVLTMLNTIKTSFDQVATSYTLPDLLNLAMTLAPVMNQEVQQMQVPVPGTYWEDAGDIWANRVNFNLNTPLIHEFIYEEPLGNFVPVPVVSNTPPDLTNLRSMPDRLVWDPIPAGFHEVGKVWPQLRYTDWKLPEDQTKPDWYFGPAESRVSGDRQSNGGTDPRRPD